MPGAPLVQAVELEKRYVDGPAVVSVLEGLGLEIEAGERIAIVGESGVGKSTLLHLLGALDRPTGGRVLFDGEDVFAWPEPGLAVFRNREVGFIFQFHHLLPDFTALENVMMPALIAGTARDTARQQAAELLVRVGLAERVDHRPGELSGGEQQRVAVARALIQQPRVVLDDEATRIHVQSRPGARYDPAAVDADVRAIYAMGFFENVEVERRPGPEGMVLVFRVRERPLVTEVKIEGNKKVRSEDLEAALKVRPHTILDGEKLRRGVVDAKKLYEE